jgi:hypothetical protein
MSLSVKRTISTFSSLKSSQFKLIFTLLVSNDTCW